MAESSEVMEGFLCPTCYMNLKTPNQLITHFQDKHEDEQDVLKSLKDLLGKAKKKIGFSQDSESEQTIDYSQQASNYQPVQWEKQELGTTRNHTSRLKLLRSARMERYCAETNKLIIRLDKLLNDMPNDAAGRKAHEQNIVVWVEDTHVKLCPSCARGFHVARRKHHCRLCGAIMCNDCSYFLTVTDAKSMITASNIGKPTLESTSDIPDIRLCEPCNQRLSHRQQIQDSRTSKPIILQYYDKLQLYRDEATSLLPEYHKMCSSLCSGESIHHLSDAKYLRIKLIKLAEAIDGTSKAILVLGGTPSGRAQRLQQAIRSAATNFLRDELVGLPSLPTETQLKLLQDKHAHVLEMRQKNEPIKSRAPQVVANTGWGPATTDKLLLDTDDIMVQQMNILKNYIKQAREARKFEEVTMLEANLRELQDEFWRQQGKS